MMCNIESMGKLLLLVALCCVTRRSISQSASNPDDDLLSKTRSLYDAPFPRGLVSFDCAVQFDWTQHFIGILGTMPPKARPTVDALQAIQHRLYVTQTNARISSIPEHPALDGLQQASTLEQVYDQMVPAGLSMWLPFSANVILPVPPTKYKFDKIGQGYKLDMSGLGLQATLLLGADLRIADVVNSQPQPMRYITEFATGPNGYLLASLKTVDTSAPTPTKEASFTFSYQPVDGFQIPFHIAVTPVAGGTWHYSLTDCKVVIGVVIKVGLPK